MKTSRLPTLYKLDKKGAVQLWTIEIGGSDHPAYRTHSGQVGGKITTSAWTMVEGKGKGRVTETSPAAQAMKEALAKFKKQQERGYSEGMENARTAQYFEPMLAHNYTDHQSAVVTELELDNPVYVQPKLDGIRCIATKDGLFSRNGKPIVSCPHIFGAVKAIFNLFPAIKVLDGELYNHDYRNDFNKIVSLVKKQKPTAVDVLESARNIQYWIYDIPSSESFSKRFLYIADSLYDLLVQKPLVKVPTVRIKDLDAIQEVFEQYVQHGYEGLIVRLNKLYENKRSRNLLKYKEFMDAEFTILGIEEGVGNRAGTAGFMRFETAEGKPFKSNVKGDTELITRYWHNRNSLVGKKATVKFFKPTPEGIPRFPFVVAIRDYE